MKKLYFLLVILITIAGSSISSEKSKPNVLIIYADDLGWSDIGCYGNIRNETPNLDKFASQGLRFTNAYAGAPICSASRASIMTGKSPARLNFEFVSTEGKTLDKPLLPPERTMELPLNEITLAEIAQKAGYTTAMFGKWHIARHNGKYLKWSDTHGPLQQGFEYGSDDYGSHPYNPENKKMVYLDEGQYPVDSLLVKTIDFLRDQEQNEKPFFLFYSNYYVHTPVVPNNSWLIEKYKRQMPDATTDQIKYAVFVETLDYYCGQLLQALNDFGLDENTLVIFTSDNGGHPKFTDNFPLRGNKWNLYEGGIREPFIVRWPGHARIGETNEPLIQWDIMPTLCELMGQNVPDKVDGESFLPLLNSPVATMKREMIYWHFPYYHPAESYEGTKPCSAIRAGKYKLIYFYEDDSSELYNLESDVSETNDLSMQMPEMTRQLKENLLNLLKEANARFPQPNPDYKHEKGKTLEINEPNQKSIK